MKSLKHNITINALKALNKSDQNNHVQGAISRENIIFLEKEGGTQKLLKKLKKIKNISKGVLVKFPKKVQDPRIDLPTVGLNTLKQSKAAGLKGIVLKHKRNIFLDKKRSIDFANKNKMFILIK